MLVDDKQRTKCIACTGFEETTRDGVSTGAKKTSNLTQNFIDGSSSQSCGPEIMIAYGGRLSHVRARLAKRKVRQVCATFTTTTVKTMSEQEIGQFLFYGFLETDDERARVHKSVKTGSSPLFCDYLHFLRLLLV